MADFLIYVGCTSWSLAYIAILRKGFRIGRVFMPPSAVIACFTWELFWLFVTVMRISSLGNPRIVDLNFALWPVFNAINIFLYLRSGHIRGSWPLKGRIMHCVVLGAGVAALLTWGIKSWGVFYALDTLGYVIALFTSALFLAMSWTIGDEVSKSLPSGVFRLIGTSCCGLASYLMFGVPEVALICLTVLGVDVLYVLSCVPLRGNSRSDVQGKSA